MNGDRTPNNKDRNLTKILTPSKEYGFRNLGNYCWWNQESCALEPRIKLKETGIQIPLTKTGMQFLESGIDSLDSGIQDCLGFPYMERKILLFILYGSTVLFEVQNNNFTIAYINHIESKFIFFPFCIIALSFWLDLRFNQNSSVVIINSIRSQELLFPYSTSLFHEHVFFTCAFMEDKKH